MTDSSDIEIERKFVVDPTFAADLTEGNGLVQGYMRSGGRASVRIRMALSTGAFTLTVKGPRRDSSRLEYETAIPEGMAQLLINEACEGRIVEKTRFPEPGPDGKLWVIDVFHGQNNGLILGEIELSDPTEQFDKPEWVLNEVTEDERYYNEYLAKHPYSTW